MNFLPTGEKFFILYVYYLINHYKILSSASVLKVGKSINKFRKRDDHGWKNSING